MTPVEGRTVRASHDRANARRVSNAERLSADASAVDGGKVDQLVRGFHEVVAQHRFDFDRGLNELLLRYVDVGRQPSRAQFQIVEFNIRFRSLALFSLP